MFSDSHACTNCVSLQVWFVNIHMYMYTCTCTCTYIYTMYMYVLVGRCCYLCRCVMFRVLQVPVMNPWPPRGYGPRGGRGGRYDDWDGGGGRRCVCVCICIILCVLTCYMYTCTYSVCTLYFLCTIINTCTCMYCDLYINFTVYI